MRRLLCSLTGPAVLLSAGLASPLTAQDQDLEKDQWVAVALNYHW